jgi:hypothetical protein
MLLMFVCISMSTGAFFFSRDTANLAANRILYIPLKGGVGVETQLGKTFPGGKRGTVVCVTDFESRTQQMALDLMLVVDLNEAALRLLHLEEWTDSVSRLKFGCSMKQVVCKSNLFQPTVFTDWRVWHLHTPNKQPN